MLISLMENAKFLQKNQSVRNLSTLLRQYSHLRKFCGTENLQPLKRLITDPIVTSFHVIRERSTWVDGHLRVRRTLADGSQLEFSEYMQRSPAGEIAVITYSYHWADADNQLILQPHLQK